MESASRIHIQNEAVSILLRANVLSKDMTPTVLHLGMDELYNRLDSLALVRQPV